MQLLRRTRDIAHYVNGDFEALCERSSARFTGEPSWRVQVYSLTTGDGEEKYLIGYTRAEAEEVSRDMLISFSEGAYGA